MYKKFIIQLFLCNLLLATSWFCVKGTQITRIASTPAFKLSLAKESESSAGEARADRFFGMLKKAASGQRIVDYAVLEKDYRYELSSPLNDNLLAGFEPLLHNQPIAFKVATGDGAARCDAILINNPHVRPLDILQKRRGRDYGTFNAS